MATPTVPSPNAEELIQQILGLTAERTKMAQESALAEQQALQEAEAQPAPQMNPLVQSLAQVSSRLGTTLAKPGVGGGQDYAAQTQKTIQQQMEEAKTGRTANLTALRATYEKAAKRAADTGDEEAQLKTQLAIKKLDEQRAKELAQAKSTEDKTAADLEWERKQQLEKTQHGYRMKEIGARESGEKTAAAADANSQEYVESLLQKVLSGEVDYKSISGGSRNGFLKEKVLKLANDRGEVILPKKVREAVDALSSAKSVVAELKEASAAINKHGPVVARGAGAVNWVTAMLGANPDAVNLDDIRDTLIGNLSRAVAAERGVLTEGDIRRAKKMFPGLGSTVDEANNKIARLERFIESKIQAARRAYAEKNAGMPTAGAKGAGTGASGATTSAAPKRIKVDLDASGNLVEVQ